MVVLDGKKLTFVIGGIFLSMFAFITANNMQNSNVVVPTVSLPVSGKTIVIDGRPWQA